MSGYESRDRQNSRARERQMARQRRTTYSSTPTTDWREKLSNLPLPSGGSDRLKQTGLFISDLFWYVTHTPQILMGIVGIVVIFFLLFLATHIFTGRIFPNVWSVGVPLGDLTVEQASAALDTAWATSTKIKLMDGDRSWEVTPAELGFQLDADKTADAARGVGLSGLPLGYSVKPVVTLDYTIAQNYLLDMTTKTDIPAYNATYAWQGDQLVGQPGTDGRMLDVPQMMEKLMADPVMVAQKGSVELEMTVQEPEVADPEPTLADAQAVASQSFVLNGYDPFVNQSVSWSTTREVLTSWLEAGQDGLTLREETFTPFLDAQIQSLNASPDAPRRYLDPKETRDHVRAAIQNHQTSVDLRIRYRPTEYEVQSGDTGFRISRKTGIPFYKIQEANPSTKWEQLSVGDIVQLPSRDVTLQVDPVPSKRIVVDLNTQTLTAFENGEEKFHWLISSGMDDAPTSPGIFQILSHNEVASGSSYTLCNSSLQCGQWEMYWFMGIYEVVPGLMNGFHGAVLLPNGNYLGGGNVGNPFTFGCVMSQNDNAKLLYDWADPGVVVEIISSEFAPESDLGQRVQGGDLSGV